MWAELLTRNCCEQAVAFGGLTVSNHHTILNARRPPIGCHNMERPSGSVAATIIDGRALPVLWRTVDSQDGDRVTGRFRSGPRSPLFLRGQAEVVGPAEITLGTFFWVLADPIRYTRTAFHVWPSAVPANDSCWRAENQCSNLSPNRYVTDRCGRCDQRSNRLNRRYPTSVGMTPHAARVTAPNQFFR